MLSGVEQKKLGKPLKLVVYIKDSEGNAQKAKITFASRFLPETPKQGLPLEIPSSLTDPIEKQLVSLLQSELKRYEKCGRKTGGLGSIYTIYGDQTLTGVGFDLWHSNSPHNQSIAKDTEIAALKSDNLDALLILYGKLQSDEQRKKFANCLIDRIDANKRYLSISYFIVCALWKLGYLNDALIKVKSALPQEEDQEYGLSNVLKLLNGLLHYFHPDFTAESLDYIEQFICGLAEHTFSIAEKITSIRAQRLL